MPGTTYLYDADGSDRALTLTGGLPELSDRQTLWTDYVAPTADELREICVRFDLRRETYYALQSPARRPRLDNYGDYHHLYVVAIQVVHGHLKLADLHFLIGRNHVLTVHEQPIEFLASFDERIKGDTELGHLDGPSFLATLLDWHMTGFFRVVEELEAEIDRLEDEAMTARGQRRILEQLTRLRRRVALVRRTLTPHREVYAALASPDFHALSTADSVAHFVTLNERLERAVDVVENARDLLVGTLEMFSTQTALRTNQEIKILTLISVVMLPAAVLASVMNLLVRAPVYDLGARGLWALLAIIALLATGTVAAARWRRWI